jgi:hypothetical protein
VIADDAVQLSQTQVPSASRSKRSPSPFFFHKEHHEPKCAWEKKLKWREDWQKTFKTEKIQIWETKYKKIQVPVWKTIEVPIWREVKVPDWKIVKKPYIKETEIPAWKEIKVPDWKKTTKPGKVLSKVILKSNISTIAFNWRIKRSSPIKSTVKSR